MSINPENQDPTWEVLPSRENLLNELAAHLREVFWVHDFRTGDLLYLSSAYEKAWGHDAGSLYESPESFVEMVYPADRTIVQAAIAELKETGSLDREFRVAGIDGTPRWAWARAFPIRDGRGEIRFVGGIGEDITDRKRAEEELRKENALVVDILESLHDGFFALDENLVVTYFNQHAEKWLGRKKEEVIGFPLFDIFTEARGSIFEEVYRRSIRNQKAETFEAYFEPPRYRNWYEVRTFPMKKGIGVFFRVTTSRKEAEAREQRRWEELKILSETAMRFVELPPEADIYELIGANLARLAEGALVSVSTYEEASSRLVCRAFTGPPDLVQLGIEVLGMNPVGLSFKIEDAEILKNMRRGALDRLPGGLPELVLGAIDPTLLEKVASRLNLKDTYAIGFSHGGKIFGSAAIISFSDREPATLSVIETFARQASITLQRKRAEAEKAALEEQLLQSQKMEAVGRLAGGIAHDFNNLLTGIMGNISLVLMDLNPRDPLYDTLSDVREAGDRAAGLTRKLLAFSRRGIFDPRLIDLNGLVQEWRRMIERMIGEDVALSERLAENPMWIKADPGHVEQVIMNLAVNARDAMPKGGRLTLETAIALFSEEEAIRNGLPGGGEFIALTVSDTGQGMGDDIKSHLFEPFFTTKPPGKGTGLGLATVYSIIKQHGGAITVDSEPGNGTVFRIYFPQAAEGREVPSARMHAPDLKRGVETILLVEDEKLVREMAAKALRRAGYRVLVAEDGEKAIRLAAQEKKLHCLLTDVVMPGMNGRTLADTLLKTRPDLKVIFTSGYTGEVMLRHGVADGDLHFIPKPYTPQALTARLRQVLDEGRQP